MFTKFLKFCQRYPIINDFMVVSFVIAVFLAVPAGKSDYVLYAEVVEAGEQTVLASSNHHRLFTFGTENVTFRDENGQTISPDELPTGAIFSFTGGKEWLETYPLQCRGIADVKIVERRPDFLKAHLDEILEKFSGASREEIQAYIDTLEDLNDEEKEGLRYVAQNRMTLP